MNDIRFALRQLVKFPGYTIVVIMTLALGIAVNVVIFSTVNVFFLKDSPLPDAKRLAIVLQRSAAFEMPHGISFPDFEDYRERSETFEDLIAYAPFPVHMSADGKAPARAWVEVVTPNVFLAMGVDSQLGRALLPTDGFDRESELVMVLSHSTWQSKFASDPDIVGKGVMINGNPFTVAGVMPEGFKAFGFSMSMAGWIPSGAVGSVRTDGAGVLEWRGAAMWKVMGKIREGVSIEQVRSEIAAIEKNIAEAHPESHQETSSIVIPENRSRPDPSMSDLTPLIGSLFVGLVALVFLIACSNVANLMLARAASRETEFTMRSALGASRWRMLRQVLVESILLALFAGIIGWLLSYVAGSLLASMWIQGDLPIDTEASATGLDYVFTICVSLFAGIASGLLPALRASRIDLMHSLKKGGVGRVASGTHFWRNTLIVGQVMASLIVLIGGGLFLKSLGKANSVSLGFDHRNLLLATYNIGLQGYEIDRGKAFHKHLLEEVRAMPGVEDAALATHFPFSYFNESLNVYPESRVPSLEHESLTVAKSDVSPGFIEMMKLELLSGRTIGALDTSDRPRVCVVNEALARVCWPGEDPIGKRMRAWEDGPFIEVVGMVKTSKYIMISEEPRPYMYQPIAQDTDLGHTFVIVRTKKEPLILADSLKSVFRRQDSHLPVNDVQSAQSMMESSMLAFMPMRMGAIFAGAQSCVGLLLAVMGLFSVVSYGIDRRRQEIGIRMALGADDSRIVKLVTKEGLRLVIIGSALGLFFSVFLGFGMSRLLYGLGSVDPTVILGAIIVMALTAGVACYWPARRATRIEPLAAMRTE